LAAAFIFGTAVAKTVGQGFVDLDLVIPLRDHGRFLGAIIWDLITWWLGLPKVRPQRDWGIRGRRNRACRAGSVARALPGWAQLQPEGEWPEDPCCSFRWRR
jgi:PiT family inorganic phosphate transporter